MEDAYPPSSDLPAPDSLTFVFRPSESTRDVRAPAMTALSTIIDRLPAPRKSVAEGIRAQTIDYPNLQSEWATGSWACYDGHQRLVFCVNGAAYFRRYNDDWNPLVMEGGISPNGQFSWKAGGISDAVLIRLAESL